MSNMSTFVKFLPTYWLGCVLYGVAEVVWNVFNFIMLMSWYKPTSEVGQLVKTTIVGFNLFPGTWTTIFAWTAYKMGIDPTLLF